MPTTEMERTVDKLARILAQHRGVSWGGLTPHTRDAWRDQCHELLVYVESTAFFGLLDAESHDEVILAPRCRACAGPFDLTELAEDDDVPLCQPHFNKWVFRFLGADDAPPCRTHLVDEESHDSGEATS